LEDEGKLLQVIRRGVQGGAKLGELERYIRRFGGTQKGGPTTQFGGVIKTGEKNQT